MLGTHCWQESSICEVGPHLNLHSFLEKAEQEASTFHLCMVPFSFPSMVWYELSTKIKSPQQHRQSCCKASQGCPWLVTAVQCKAAKGRHSCWCSSGKRAGEKGYFCLPHSCQSWVCPVWTERAPCAVSVPCPGGSIARQWWWNEMFLQCNFCLSSVRISLKVTLIFCGRQMKANLPGLVFAI